MSVAKKNFHDPGKYYTYEDYITWDESLCVEIIDGVIYPRYGSEPMFGPDDPRIYNMAGPNLVHQEIAVEISTQLRSFLRGKTCRVLTAPFDVKLNPSKNEGIVQPDILVVCDSKKLENGKYCNGAPEFVIEILSPSTSKKDTHIKSRRYFDAGVLEYWMVNPEDKTIVVLKRAENCFTFLTYGDKDIVPVSSLEGCTIDMSLIFPSLPEEEEENSGQAENSEQEENK